MTLQTVDQIVAGLHPLEVKVLEAFKAKRVWWSSALQEKAALDSSQLDMALGWLQAKGLVAISNEKVSSKKVCLTDLGKRYASQLLPELRIKKQLELTPRLTIQELKSQGDLDPEELSSAIGGLKKRGVIAIGEGGLLRLEQKEGFRDLEQLQSFIKNVYKDGYRTWGNIGPDYLLPLIEERYHKRGKEKGVFEIVEEREREYTLVAPLGEETIKRLSGQASVTELGQLTPQILKEGSWRNRAFRKYNIQLKPARISIGKKHPYREFLDQIKMKLVAMGFEEMRGGLVESEFWNSDALFMPQFHPARAIHDVYFVADPLYTTSLPRQILTRVAKTHKNGWETGSSGWRYAFDSGRARRLVLRSQGTAVSAHTLASHPKIPGKYFSIARCFRYDQVDATHAPDFYQIEGIVLGEAIHFRTLLGLLKLFAIEMAKAKEIKFLPAYFPYTEPSVELHAKHPELGWMELGGAGLFRPEVTLPLGIRVPVIAWGLGLDRMAMVALGIADIRDLFSADLDFVRTRRVLY